MLCEQEGSGAPSAKGGEAVRAGGADKVHQKTKTAHPSDERRFLFFHSFFVVLLFIFSRRNAH